MVPWGFFSRKHMAHSLQLIAMEIHQEKVEFMARIQLSTLIVNYFYFHTKLINLFLMVDKDISQISTF